MPRDKTVYSIPQQLYHLEKCGARLPKRFLHSVLSICLALVLPEDTTSYQTHQDSAQDIKGNAIVPVLVPQS